jgi:chitinase
MQRRLWLSVSMLALAGIWLAWAQAPVSNTLLPKRLIGDYGYWSKYDTPPYSAAQIPFDKLTHINHCCVGFNADGSLSISSQLLEPLLISKAQAHGVHVLMLLSGNNFPGLETNPASVQTLASNLAAFAAQNGYEGVDVDWEYPSSSTDRQTFFALIQALRQAFPRPNYFLSADVPPWGGTGYDFEHTQGYVNYYNLMMYDCAGPWTNDAQLNSPIFPDPKNPAKYNCEPGGSVDQAIDVLMNKSQVPADKINMGSPFYGYWYQNVSKLWGFCHPCTGHTVVSKSYGKFLKPRINHEGWRSLLDPVALVPYMLRNDGSPGFITYDDASSTYYRVWYSVWQRGLGGSFMWSLDQDYDGSSQDLLDAMYYATTHDTQVAPAP